MSTEREILAELERRGWKYPTDAVLSHWPEVCRTMESFDFRDGRRLCWPVRGKAPPTVPIGQDEAPDLRLIVVIEYWQETGTYDGQPSFRMLGCIPGISASQIEVQKPTQIR